MSKQHNTKISGTKEWAAHSFNCVLGCSHRCRYCYAAAMATQRKQCPTRIDWGVSYNKVRANQVSKKIAKLDGRIMFPTTHDITPEHLDSCLTVISNILEAGNELLIVSKPHLECIQKVCQVCEPYKDKVTFRFSIGAITDDTLSYWEPGAPSFKERFESLKHAHHCGYNTSVSAEPLLESHQAYALWCKLSPYITNSLWIGKMNDVHRRCAPDTNSKMITAIEAGQTDQKVKEIYSLLKNNDKIKWKESYKAVVGLDLPTEAGLDI